MNFAIVIATFIGMEAFSWTIHKYLFHGPLWFIHKTHHQPQRSFFELNDLFSLVFAFAGIALLYVGRKELSYNFWIGVGISFYGILYFIFHDWFIHQRIKAFKSTNRYLLGIRKAHKIHHKSVHKNPSESFGLWLAPFKYFK